MRDGLRLERDNRQMKKKKKHTLVSVLPVMILGAVTISSYERAGGGAEGERRWRDRTKSSSKILEPYVDLMEPARTFQAFVSGVVGVMGAGSSLVEVREGSTLGRRGARRKDESRGPTSFQRLRQGQSDRHQATKLHPPRMQTASS